MLMLNFVSEEPVCRKLLIMHVKWWMMYDNNPGIGVKTLFPSHYGICSVGYAVAFKKKKVKKLIYNNLV